MLCRRAFLTVREAYTAWFVTAGDGIFCGVKGNEIFLSDICCVAAILYMVFFTVFAGYKAAVCLRRLRHGRSFVGDSRRGSVALPVNCHLVGICFAPVMKIRD